MTDTDLTSCRIVWERRDDVQILDVREQWEWDAGHIDGAVHIPLNDVLAGKTAGLDPALPVVAYCKTGPRSEVATLMLQARGFQAHNMEGGSEAWCREGLPFVDTEGKPGRVV